MEAIGVQGPAKLQKGGHDISSGLRIRGCPPAGQLVAATHAAVFHGILRSLQPADGRQEMVVIGIAGQAGGGPVLKQLPNGQSQVGWAQVRAFATVVDERFQIACNHDLGVEQNCENRF